MAESSFQEGAPPPPDKMKQVCRLLDECEGPYLLLFPDAGGTHCFEDCSDKGMQELVTTALLVLGDMFWREGRQADYAAWLQKFIDEYGPEGSRAVYQQCVEEGQYAGGR